MDTLQKFIAYFEKNTKKRITHTQLKIASVIFETNEGIALFGGQGRGQGKTLFLTAIEAFAHNEERKIGGAEVKP